MNEMVKVGDTVMWRGGFGSDPEMSAVIESIELCELEHMKYGEGVEEVDVMDLRRCCVSLTNGSWAYGYQCRPIAQKPAVPA